MSVIYKVWVKIEVERIEYKDDDADYRDIWEAPFPVPVYISEDEDKAIAFAEGRYALLEQEAVDGSRSYRIARGTGDGDK